MSSEGALGYVVEPQRKVPIAYDVDVAVVGAGVSGMFAALAAGRLGVKTLMIDRFGAIGGNLGPAMIVGGSAVAVAPETLMGGLAGITKELATRMEQLQGIASHNYAEQSNMMSYLGVKMAEEWGVELLLSVWAADPIVEDNRVTGLFVEGKSGRVAIKSKIVIDGTGAADVARRAGVPVITDLPPDPSWSNVIGPRFLDPEYKVWNDTGIFYVVANIDSDVYREFVTGEVTLSDEDKVWLEERNKFPIWSFAMPDPLVPIIRKAWESGEYLFQKDVEPKVHLCLEYKGMSPSDSGLVASRVNMGGEIRQNDMLQHSRLESAIRTHVFETVQFLRKNVPGYENSYLLLIAPYLGGRGGPYIDGEYVVTPDDVFTGKRFDDVVCRNISEPERGSGGESSGYDMPYRMLLPKKLDGLMAAGTTSGYVRRGHDPGVRARAVMMAIGEVAGTAAALAVRDGVEPRNLDVRKLQRELLSQGYLLGEPERLRELGLA